MGYPVSPSASVDRSDHQTTPKQQEDEVEEEKEKGAVLIPKVSHVKKKKKKGKRKGIIPKGESLQRIKRSGEDRRSKEANKKRYCSVGGRLQPPSTWPSLRAT